MKNTSGAFLLCALYNIIAQAIPLGSSAPPITNTSITRANPAAIGAATAGDGQVVLQGADGLPQNTSYATTTPMVVATIRTITSIVTHTLPWSPQPTPDSPTSSWPITVTAIATTLEMTASSKNGSRLPWNLEEQPPAMVKKVSILWAIGSILCISLAYILINIVCTLSRHRTVRQYCCFWVSPSTEDTLRGVELEESAGVSWTEGSNHTTPPPEARAPEEWSGSWANMAAVGQAGSSGSTGSAGVRSRGTVRRSRNTVQ